MKACLCAPMPVIAECEGIMDSFLMRILIAAIQESWSKRHKYDASRQSLIWEILHVDLKPWLCVFHDRGALLWKSQNAGFI